ncbi:hypothetical protein MCT07_07570 [Vibrio aestuarianus]|nr:hypothetical protein [Vibrio aestuarianus]
MQNDIEPPTLAEIRDNVLSQHQCYFVDFSNMMMRKV